MGDYMKFLFDPNGRVSRKDIWLKYLLVVIAANLVAGTLDLVAGLLGAAPFGAAVSLFFFWPGIAVSVKRFHDRDMTGWWVLILAVIAIVGAVLFILPLFSILSSQGMSGGGLAGSSVFMVLGGLILIGVVLFSFVVNYCLPGQVGANKYGPDPLDPLDGTIDAFN